MRRRFIGRRHPAPLAVDAEDIARREELRIAHIGRPQCYRREKLMSEACDRACMLATNGRTDADTVRVLCGERLP